MKRGFSSRREDNSKKNDIEEDGENPVNDENDKDQLNEENNENAGPSRKKKRTSTMWNHFTVKFVQKENAEFAFCNYCTK